MDYDLLKQMAYKEDDLKNQITDSFYSANDLENSLSNQGDTGVRQRVESIMKKNFISGVKAKNIYSAVQEISENEFMNQIEQDMNEKNKRYKHLKQDLRRLHKKAKTLSKYFSQKENNDNSQFDLKKINQNLMHSSAETTQIINQSKFLSQSRVSSGLLINKILDPHFINAKMQQSLLKKSMLNEDSIFSILGFETVNKSKFSKNASKPSIMINPHNKNQIDFHDFSKKLPNPVPKRWKLAKIDYIEKNLNFDNIKKNEKKIDEEKLEDNDNYDNRLSTNNLTLLKKNTLNKIEKFRKVFLIYGNFTKFSPIKVAQILLPIYVKKFDFHLKFI